MTGMCPAMQTLENVVAEIAPTNIPVFFVGESGTGKAMFAQRVHRLSSRSQEPLLTISCAAMNSAQLASELGLAPAATQRRLSERRQRHFRRNQRTGFRQPAQSSACTS